MIGRRRFVCLGGAAVAACFFEAGAQQAKAIGVLIQGGPQTSGVAGLREGLAAAGLGQVDLIVKDGGGDLAALRRAAAELEAGAVDVIVAFSTSVALAAKDATTKVPLVFAAGSDPVAFGLVDTIARPGGRATGLHSLMAEVTAKRFQLLRELVPTARRALSLYNPANPISTAALASAREAAGALGFELVAVPAGSPAQVRRRLEEMREGQADAFFFVNDSMILSQDVAILGRAKALRMATIAYELELVAKGALAGYGLNYREFGRVAARYVARIRAGTPPHELPVEAIQPGLAINLLTAKSLGLVIPTEIIARADEVIE